jgi:hypothetical protein
MKKVLFFAALFGFLALGCGADDDHGHDGDAYFVNIDIQIPAPGAKAAVGAPMPVKVVFTREDDKTIHIVKISVVDASNKPVATLFDQHVHMPGEYVFESASYAPAQAGSFKLQAVSMNEAGEFPNLREAGFEVE